MSCDTGNTLPMTRTYLIIVLAVLSMPLFFLNIQETHGWGDDFALYIKEAQNIATCRPFNEHTWIFNPYNIAYSPPQYPPGYPLLLAPVIKTFGTSILAISYMNALISAGLLFALYGYFRNHAGNAAAICLAVMISYTGCMIDLKSAILADVACMLFIVLYLWLRERCRNTPLNIAMMILMAVCAIQTRSQAICIVAAEAMILFIGIVAEAIRNKGVPWGYVRSQPLLFVLPGVLVIHYVLGAWVFPTSISTMPFYYNIADAALRQTTFASACSGMYDGVSRTAALPFIYTSLPASWVDVSVIVICILAAIGIVIKLRRKPGASDGFFVVMLALLMYYPLKDARYFIPLFPALALYVYYVVRIGLTKLPLAAKPIVALAVTLLYLGAGGERLVRYATEHPGGLPEQKEIDAFAYIKKHVRADKIIVFVKPRLLALYTGKRTVNTAWQVPFARNKEIFDSMGVKYLLILNGLEDVYFRDYMQQVSPPVDSTVIGDGYTLYTLRE